MDEDFDKEASYVGEDEIIDEMLVVKNEILNYYDNEFESTPFSVQRNREPLLHKEIQSSNFQSSCSGLMDSENSQNKLLSCNKIILGSKPNRFSGDEDNFDKSANIYEENNEVSIDENYFEELVTSYEPSVVLQDIQSYLQKSKRYCDSCSRLFPEQNSYESHVKIFHTVRHLTKMSHKESLTERRQHKCSICAKLFVAPHVLRRHLIHIHKFNNAEAFENTSKETCPKVIENTTEESSGKIIENTSKEVNASDTMKKSNVFETITKEANAKVIENTIKETNAPEITHESSDLSNACFHCRKTFDTQKSLIEHLYDILQMKRKNTEIVPVLKSVLFKCNKCDIHFTSSQLAANHSEHMEMLINWKCTICNRIFKKEDELSHERQHSVSNNFLIYNLGDLDVANILFRCSKCAIHFTESNFLYHFRDCSLEVTKTVTCKICNILLDYNLKTLHEFDKHTESKPFTIIQCDVISDNPVKSTVTKSQTREKLNELLKSFREVKVVLQKIDSSKINRLTKSGTVVLPSKSASRSTSKSSSLGKTSSELPKMRQFNEVSGKLWRTRLRISKNTSRKLMLLHGLNKTKPVNIADHSVLRKRNLTYSYCRICKCFITKYSKVAHIQERCKKLSEMAWTCEHCGLILNKASIRTHRRLHMERKDIKLQDFRFFNLYTGRAMNPPTPEYPKCTHCEVHFLTKTTRKYHICSEVAYHTCHLCEIKLSDAAFKLHMTFHQYATDRMKRDTKKNSQSAASLNTGKCFTGKNIPNTMKNYTQLTHNQFDGAETTLTEKTNLPNAINDKTKSDALQVVHKKKPVSIGHHLALTKRNMIYYYCETCKCFVTKFRKEAHVQGRCKKLGKIACTCEHCGLILNDTSIVTHRRLHMEKRDLTLKNFRFFNLYTGRSMNPPIPEYLKCTHCAVHFISKTTMKYHVCSKAAYQTCNVCGMKLSERAFKLHMAFHQYATNRNKIVVTKTLQAAKTLDVVKRVDDENDTDSPENKNELPIDQLGMAEMKLFAIRRRRNICRKFEMNEENALHAVNKKRPVNSADLRRRRNFTYFHCETCKCFVTKFKNAIHVHGRCKKLANMACTCEHCGLILNKASIATHRRLHVERKDLQLKDFRFFNLYTGRSMNPPIPEYPKCTYCAVHFVTKRARYNHICSAQSYQACRLCNMKLSQAAFNLHMRFHQYATNRNNRVISKKSHSATTWDVEKCGNKNVSNSTESDTELIHNPIDVSETNLPPNTSQEYKVNDNEIERDALQLVKKNIPVNITDHLALTKRNVTYSYCETCQCFVTKFRKAVHVQGRCKKLSKKACTCEHCGLILTDTSRLTHRRLHEDRKDLQLNDFRFFNLYTGRSMNPPLPAYPKCAHCDVHFLTKTTWKYHVCTEVAYHTCHICELKFSEAAFKLHMAFHQYATNRINKATMKKLQSAMTLHMEKRVTNEDLSKNTENGTELLGNPHDMAEPPVQNYSEMDEILYFCGNCSVSVDTYDKVVEHCQGHYEVKDQEIQTKVCNYCELSIDVACYTDHHNLHEKGKQFKLLKFDSYYLPSENNMWVKHIFQSLPNEKVLEILRSSIYKYECRMKMDVIQQGDPNLTVYRCDQCSCFIEPSSLFRHSDNSCFKLRHHPCIVCGIPFNSSASRSDHEQIHNRPGITTGSYRIVVFNRERDKQINRSFCLRKSYVLFQCRNCGTIINKLQGDIHTCDISNVKKCPQCALLLHSKDYEKHVNTHKEFVSFNSSNMKIIILGDSHKDRNENTLRSHFKGAIYDYKMYVCKKCDICVKNETSMSNHICRFGKQRLKCLKCDLYFSVGRLKTHTRSHEHDPDFVRLNMNIVLFDPCTVDQNKNTTIVCDNDCERSDSNTDSDTEILATNDTRIANVVETIGITPEIHKEETVKLYKCTCELHFLNEDSIIRHFGVCRSKTTISKQKCPKCDLLFTSNVLFTHLLAHHNKKKCYIYDVIEMDHTYMNMLF